MKMAGLAAKIFHTTCQGVMVRCCCRTTFCSALVPQPFLYKTHHLPSFPIEFPSFRPIPCLHAFQTFHEDDFFSASYESRFCVWSHMIRHHNKQHLSAVLLRVTRPNKFYEFSPKRSIDWIPNVKLFMLPFRITMLNNNSIFQAFPPLLILRICILLMCSLFLSDR